MWKASALLTLLLLSSGFASAFDTQIEDSRIESVNIPENTDDSDINISLKEEERTNNLDYIAIYESLKLEMEDRVELEIWFEEDSEWSRNWMKENPEAFEGPGQEYNPYFMSAYRGDSMMGEPLDYRDGSYLLNTDKPGIYYIGFEGIEAEFSHYVNEDGGCNIHYNGSGFDNLEEVDECPGEGLDFDRYLDNFLYILGFVSISLLAISVTWFKLLPTIRERILIIKLEKLTEKCKNLDKNQNSQIFEDLIDANKAIEQNNYSKASSLISEIKESISSK